MTTKKLQADHGYRCTFEGCDLSFPTSAALSEHVGLEHIACTTSVESDLCQPLTTPKPNVSISSQIMDYVRNVNPFDEKFREANKKTFKRSDSVTEILSFLRTTSTVAVAGSDLSFTSGPSLITTTADVGLGDCSSLPNLSLKLPDASSLFSGIGLDTPDISSLVSQVVRDESPAKSAPQTADVLKAVLEMRETVELQEAEKRRKKSLEEIKTTQNQLNFDQDAFSLRSNYEEVGERFNLDNDVRPLLAASPPSLQNFDNSSDPIQQIPLQLSNASMTEIGADDPMMLGDNKVYISVKINDQTVRIPIQIGFAGGREPSSTPSVESIPTATPNPSPVRTVLQKNISNPKAILPATALSQVPAPITFLQETADSSIYSPKLISIQSAAVKPTTTACTFLTSSNFGGYPLVVTPSFQTESKDASLKTLERQCNSTFSNESGSPPSHISQNFMNDDCKKKETLERNKQAAWRYRKRKKEEMGYLAEKVKVLENEKLELSTQVQVLKMELNRVNKILDDHKNCCTKGGTVPKTMAATGVVNDGPKIKLDNKERVDSFADQSASSSSASNVVQYIAVPASSVGSADGDRILTASTGSGTAQFLLQQFVLSNGQLVVSANSQMPYILPLVRRSSSSSDNVNDGS